MQLHRVFRRQRIFVLLLYTICLKSEIQLSVLSSHLSWHYSPSLPRRGCSILFLVSSCTQQKERSCRINTTVHAFTSSVRLSRNEIGNIPSWNSKGLSWCYLKSDNTLLQAPCSNTENKLPQYNLIYFSNNFSNEYFIFSIAGLNLLGRRLSLL